MAEPVKLKNGNYKIRVRFKNPITDKWMERQKQFPTKRECRQWERSILGTIDTVNPDRILLATFFDEWYDTFKKHSVGPDHNNKIKATKRYILEFFGENVKLQDINRMKYQQWINYLGVTKNLAVATVRGYHLIFRSMLLEAQENSLIRENPSRKVKIIGRDTSEEKKRTLTMDEWKKLLEVILEGEECSSKYAAITMMFIGCRFQEVDGLLTQDIDFKKDKININKAYDYKRTKTFTKTKTPGSKRVVDMPQPLKDILKIYVRKLQQDQKIISLEDKKHIQFLFPGDLEGCPVTNKALNQYLERKCRRAGIERITSHAFRHAKTDMLVLAGADMIYTQKQLGHDDPATTLRYYSSLNEEIRDKNNKIQDSFFDRVMSQ